MQRRSRAEFYYYLDTFRDVYHLEPPEISIAVRCQTPGISYMVSDTGTGSDGSGQKTRDR
jgi:hypothetical protein